VSDAEIRDGTIKKRVGLLGAGVPDATPDFDLGVLTEITIE
jgi:hypothetical protein